MFVSQVQRTECLSGPAYKDMLGAFPENPARIVLACPNYIFPYVPGGAHLSNRGYRWMGEYYAKAYYQHVVKGIRWQGVQPVSVNFSGPVITIHFTAPVPPLVFDTISVAQAADGNFGFTYAGPEAITNVAITDAANGIVQISLSGTPTANGLPVRYAATGVSTGPITGARGNLRDSDPTVGLDGNHLYNWAFHFAKNKVFR